MNETAKQLAALLSEECQSLSDVQDMLKTLFKGTIETMLEAEMDEHLGYEKNSIIGNNSGNSRNGYGKKTIKSELGETEIRIPRDRNGEFEPQLIEKRQTRTEDLENRVLAMYSKGMTTRDIEDHLRDIYGVEASASMISRITDKIMPAVTEWQNRPLDAIYPIVFLDGIVFKVRNSTKYVSYKDLKPLMADLKLIYGAPTLEDAEYHLEELREKWGKKYPQILKSWDANWAELTTYFKYPQEVRTLIYTTNAVEGFHRMLRKFTKTKSIYPTDDAVRKSVYLSIQEISRKWTMPIRDWGIIIGQLSIFFEDRFKLAS